MGAGTEGSYGDGAALSPGPASARSVECDLPPMSRRFLLACGLGLLVTVVTMAFFVSMTKLGPGVRNYSDDFYDAQVRAWSHGDWNVPDDVAGGEGFVTPDGIQIYYGITPSLLRLPVLALTDVDGGLAELSQWLALGVLVVSSCRILWAARCLWRRDDAGVIDDVVAALFVVAVGAGSSATYLAAQPTIYAEAILWGAALALAGADQLVRLLVRPTAGRAFAAAALAAAAANARVTTGFGAVVAVGVVGICALSWRALGNAARVGSRAAGEEAHVRLRRLTSALVPSVLHRRWALVLVAGAMVGTAVFCGVNYARFDNPVRAPIPDYVIYRFESVRSERLGADPPIFAPRFIGTNVAGYLRPDSVRLTPFPVVSFLDLEDTVIVADAVPNFVEPTASVEVSMPVLFVLSLVGAVSLIRGPKRARLAAFRVPVVGAAAAAAGLFFYALDIAHRFTGDLMPLLVLLGAIGAARAGEVVGRARRVACVSAIAIATAWSVWVTVGLTMTSVLIAPSSLRVREAVDAWAAASSELEAGLLGDPVIPRVATLPSPTLWARAASPDCARVYVGTGPRWYAFERAPGTGAFDLRVSMPPDDGAVHPVVRTSQGSHLVGLRASPGGAEPHFSDDGGRTWRFSTAFRGLRGDGTRVPTPIPAGVDGQVAMLVDFDRFAETVTVSGETPDTFLVLRDELAEGGGEAVLDPAYPGTIAEVALAPTRCERWTAGG